MEGLVVGDVVVVDYPYTDLTTTKRRPALLPAVFLGTDRLNVILEAVRSLFPDISA